MACAADITRWMLERCTPLRGHSSAIVAILFSHSLFLYAAVKLYVVGSAAAATAAASNIFAFLAKSTPIFSLNVEVSFSFASALVGTLKAVVILFACLGIFCSKLVLTILGFLRFALTL